MVPYSPSTGSTSSGPRPIPSPPLPPSSSPPQILPRSPSLLPTPRPHYHPVTPVLLAKIERRLSPPSDIPYLPITLAVLNPTSATSSTNVGGRDVSWWRELLQSRTTSVFLRLRRAQSPSTIVIQGHNNSHHSLTEAIHMPSNVHSRVTPQLSHLSFVNYSRPFASSNNPYNQRSFHRSPLQEGGDSSSISHPDNSNRSRIVTEENGRDGEFQSLITNTKPEDYIPERSTSHLTQPVYAVDLIDSSERKYHSSSTVSEAGSSDNNDARPEDEGSSGGSSGYDADDENVCENISDAVVCFKAWALGLRIDVLERAGPVLYPRSTSHNSSDEEAEES